MKKQEEVAHLLAAIRSEEEYRHCLAREHHILRIWEVTLQSSKQGMRVEVEG